jgi:DNA polymerase III gamma/tau subunit
MQVSDESLMLIAKQGEGSMRDAITLLGRFQENTSDSHIREQLGLMPNDVLQNLVESVARDDRKAVFDILDSNDGGDWPANWTEFVNLFEKLTENRWQTSEFDKLAKKLVYFKNHTYDVMQSSCPKTVISLISTVGV